MCLAVPARITEVSGDRAVVEMAGVSRETSLMLVEGAAAGDYVLVHAGFAIEKLDEQEALRAIELFQQMEELA